MEYKSDPEDAFFKTLLFR